MTLQIRGQFADTKSISHSVSYGMRKIKTCLCALTAFLTLCNVATSSAQTYRSTLGLRYSDGSDFRQLGATFQYRLAEPLTFEGIFQTDFRDNHTTHLLLEHHRPLIGHRFNWYYGAGVSFGREESYWKNPETREKIFTYGNSTVGADLILGVEVTLARLNISWDMKPNFNLVGRQNWATFQTGISVRAVLVSQKDVKKRKREREKAKKERWF